MHQDTLSSNSCPFCNLNPEKSRILFETENTLTILSNPALIKGHCLVIPKRHVEKLSELSNNELKELIEQTIKIEEILLKKFPGCDIRQNFRPFQSQNNLKVNHLHLHLQPQEFEDELYKKCQILEKDIFKDLSESELNKLKQMLTK